MNRETSADLTKLADAAFRLAAVEVIERAEAAGTPVIVWENDKIKRLTPRQARETLKRKTKKRKRR
jgi:hypothetical protein